MDTIWILENLEIYLEQLSYANLLFNCKFYENQTLIKYVQRKFSIWIERFCKCEIHTWFQRAAIKECKMSQ